MSLSIFISSISRLSISSSLLSPVRSKSPVLFVRSSLGQIYISRANPGFLKRGFRCRKGGFIFIISQKIS